MRLSTDEYEIRLTWKHIDHVRDEGFSLNLNHWFGNAVTGPPKTLTEPRHWNYNFHRSSFNFSPFAMLRRHVGLDKWRALTRRCFISNFRFTQSAPQERQIDMRYQS